MAVAFVNQGTAATGSTSLAVPFPGSIAAGNLLILCVVHKATNPPTTPAGWTLVERAGQTDTWGGFYVLTATGSESGTVSVTGLTSSAVGWMVQFSGAAVPVRTTNTWFGTSTGISAFSAADASNHSAAAGDAEMVIGAGGNDATATGTWSGSTNLGSDIRNYTSLTATSTTTGTDCYLGGGYLILGSAHSFGQVAVSSMTWNTGGTPAEITIGIHIPAGTGNQTVTPTGISSAEALGAPTVLLMRQDVAPNGVASAETMGSPRTQITVPLNGVSTAEALGSPQINRTAPVNGIASAEALGSPTLVPGSVTVLGTGISSAEALGAPTVSVTGGTQTVSPTGISTAGALGAPTVLAGSVTVQPSGIATAGAMGSPVVFGTAAQTVTLTGFTPDDELTSRGFNGNFDTTISPWYIAGPAGGSVTRDTSTFTTGSASLKLVHGSGVGAWSEAGNDDAFANGAGRKRISFWMKSNIIQPEVQVWPFFGSAPLDWADFVTLRFSVNTNWQYYEAEFDQTLPMWTGLYFDQMSASASPGDTIWVDDIRVATAVGRPTIIPPITAVQPTGFRADGAVGDIIARRTEFILTLPIEYEMEPRQHETALARLGIPEGVTIYRANGTWHAARNLGADINDIADRIYRGGYDNVIDDPTERAELVAAGFGFQTRMV